MRQGRARRWIGAVVVAASAVILLVCTQARAAFPGLNGKIAFTVIVDAANDQEQIASVNSDGTGLEWFAAYQNKNSKPSWSADGEQLTFSRHPENGVLAGQRIYFANADGSDPQAIDTGLEPEDNALDYRSAWSPDGTKVVFVSNRDQDGDGITDDDEIYVVGVDGAGLTQCTTNNRTDGFPDWSPLDTKIAFSGTRNGDSDIIVRDSDCVASGSNLTDSDANDEEFEDNQPSWSPDGSRIAFVTDRDGDKDIHTMDADDGGNPTNVTDLTDDGNSSDELPAWSPDGTKIAFSSDREGTYDIYVIDADGTGDPVQVAGDPTKDESWPDWQPVAEAAVPAPVDPAPVDPNPVDPPVESSPDTVAPTISGLKANHEKISMRALRRTPSKAVYFKFKLSEAVSVRVKLYRRKKRSKKYLQVGSSFKVSGKMGTNKAKVSKTLAKKLRSVAPYKATAQVTDDADLDLLVSLAEDRPDAAVKLAVRLERAVGREVDIARLDRVEERAPLILLQALDEGRVVLDRDRQRPELRARRQAIARRARRAHAARRRRAGTSVRELIGA